MVKKKERKGEKQEETICNICDIMSRIQKALIVKFLLVSFQQLMDFWDRFELENVGVKIASFLLMNTSLAIDQDNLSVN